MISGRGGGARYQRRPRVGTIGPVSHVPARRPPPKGDDVEQVEAFLGRAGAAARRGLGAEARPTTSLHVRDGRLRPRQRWLRRRGRRRGARPHRGRVRRREKQRGEDGPARRLARPAAHPGAVARAKLARPDGERLPRGSGMELPTTSSRSSTCAGASRTPRQRRRPSRADAVRLAAFKSRRGGRGYREASVDAFLDRVVESWSSPRSEAGVGSSALADEVGEYPVDEAGGVVPGGRSAGGAAEHLHDDDAVQPHEPSNSSATTASGSSSRAAVRCG